jgi:catechol 2,3-dioxygenase-like lactoylglutathione lyase family enzyme
MTTYKLHAVRIFVSDWSRALEFYAETLGMPVAFANEAMGWAELATEGSHLALERAAPDDAESRELVGRFLGVSLQVPDVAAAYTELRSRGVDFVEPPERQPWGGTLAHFRDPDGNVLTLLGSA